METKNILIPELSVPGGVSDIDFYKKAFGAVELWRIKNDDGSVHVAAFSVLGNEFRLHEERENGGVLSPKKTAYTTVKISLNVEDVAAVTSNAIDLGAKELMPVTDFEYGYRQAEIQDPFGHRWVIEKLFNKEALDRFIKTQSDK